jgi:hypothetical protein
MDTPWRLVAALALVLALPACSSDNFFSERDLHGYCGSDPEKRIESANWDDAETVDLRIRLGSFWPMILTLRRDRPYILRISNVDPERRVFSATPLFQTAYLQSVTVEGREPEFNPIDGLRLPPAGKAEVRMMALCAGRFEFFEAWLSDLRLETSQGVVYVE